MDEIAGPSTVAKLDDRIRLENSLTLITYHEDSSRFVVDRFRHSHQSSMGEPQSKGARHVLSPEEATYLVECAQALVRTTNGRCMTLEELFAVLGECSVPQKVYSAYCACKRAGFVVVRHPGMPEKHTPSASPSRTVSPPPFAPSSSQEPALLPFRVLPRALLDAFPDMSSDTTWLRPAHPDLVPEGCRLREGTESEKEVVVEEGRSKGKKRKEPSSLRPRSWPSLAHASANAKDWREYATMRAAALNKSQKKRHQSSLPLSHPHFLLYSSRGYSHSGRRRGDCQPIASVAVFDFYSGRACKSLPPHPSSPSDVPSLNIDHSTVPLLKAHVSNPRISFTRESGAPITLYWSDASKQGKTRGKRL